MMEIGKARGCRGFMMALIAILLVALFPVVAAEQTAYAAGSTYYVSPAGVDSGSRNGSSGQPWKTLSYAATRVPADAGHTIQLSAGTFVETGPAYIPTGVNIAGAGPSNTIIKSAYFHSTAGYDENYYLIQASSGSQTDGNQTFSGFTLDGDARQSHGGMLVRHRNNVTVHNVHIKDFNWNGFWIHQTSNNFHIYNSTFTNNSWGSTGYNTGALQVGDITNSSIHDITINEDRGYGIKALGYSTRYFENVDFYNLKISVPNTCAWANGLAPCFTIELHDSTLNNVDIYSSSFNNNLSLVGNSVGSNKTVRVHDNVIDAHNGYAIESCYSYMEVDHNYITGGPYPFACWANHYTDQSFHHNVVYDISPGEVFRSAGGVDNLQIYNNTFELNKPGTVNIVRMYGGNSANLQIKNNIFWSTGSSGNVISDPGGYISSYTVANNLFHNYSGSGLGTGNITAFPDLASSGDRRTAYYAPVTGSAVINAGLNVGLPYAGAAPDMGAFEFNGGSSAVAYEAEVPGNTIGGAAYVEICAVCSGGKNVKNVGNNNGTLQFNKVNVAAAGTYTLKIYYISGENRNSTMSVNGGSGVSVSFPNSGSWSTVGSKTVTVELAAGYNTIKFSNAGAGVYSPDFDRIELAVMAEAEASGHTVGGGAYISACSFCSAGQNVKNVGNNNGTLQLNGIKVASAGSYTLKVFYTSGENRTSLMSVNGGTGTTFSFPSTGSWSSVGSVTLTVNLNAGNNAIKFYHSTGSYAPDFDRVEVY